MDIKHLKNLRETLNEFRDKDKRNYKSSYEKCKEYIDLVNEWAIYNVILIIIECLESETIRGQREYCYKVLNYICKKNKTKVKYYIAELIPKVVQDINSTIKENKDASLKVFKLLIESSGNEDLVPFLPVVLDAILNPKNTADAVEKLASCIFVQNVEASALSVITPILLKGLNIQT